MNKKIFLVVILFIHLNSCSKFEPKSTPSAFPISTSNPSSSNQNPKIVDNRSPTPISSLPSPIQSSPILLIPSPATTPTYPSTIKNTVAKVEDYLRCSDNFKDELGLPVKINRIFLFAITPDQQYIYVFDNNKIHKIQKGDNFHKIIQSTLVHSEKVWSMTATNRELFFTDAHQVKRITSSGNLDILAGQQKSGYQDGSVSTALFKDLRGITLDKTNNIYVSEEGNYSIRKISISDQEVSTIVGPFTNQKKQVDGYAEDGPIEESFVNIPSGIAVDSEGKRVYVSELSGRIRLIENNLIKTIAGKPGQENRGYRDGQGNQARFNSPDGIQLSHTNSLYVVDYFNNVIRKIAQDGNVSTIAGNANFNVDFCFVENIPCSREGVGQDARFSSPQRLSQDENGNLYVDNGSCLISKISFVEN